MITTIYRHRRENLKKCSLRGLEKRGDLNILTYPIDPLPDLSNYLLLKVGAPPLTEKDAHLGLFFIDATWRLAQVIEKNISLTLEARSLPQGFQTAYPRYQTGCSDPTQGLSTLEALFIAHLITKRPIEGLLTHYYWKDRFFELNHQSLKPFQEAFAQGPSLAP